MCLLLSQEIMEKWSRPIFSKVMDERGGKTFLTTADVSLRLRPRERERDYCVTPCTSHDNSFT